MRITAFLRLVGHNNRSSELGQRNATSGQHRALAERQKTTGDLLFGAERVLLTPDCGFATFADNPVASPAIAEAKLRAIAQATEILRGR